MQRAEVWEKPQRIACWFQRNNPEDWLWKTRVYQDLSRHWERPPGRSLHNAGLPLTGQHGVQETRQMGHAGWACCSSCVRSKHKLFTNLAPIGEQFPSGHSLTEELARLPRSYRWPSLYPHRVGGGGGAWEGAHVLTYHTALNPGLIVLKALRAAPGREPWIKKTKHTLLLNSPI